MQNALKRATQVSLTSPPIDHLPTIALFQPRCIRCLSRNSGIASGLRSEKKAPDLRKDERRKVNALKIKTIAHRPSEREKLRKERTARRHEENQKSALKNFATNRGGGKYLRAQREPLEEQNGDKGRIGSGFEYNEEDAKSLRKEMVGRFGFGDEGTRAMKDAPMSISDRREMKQRRYNERILGGKSATTRFRAYRERKLQEEEEDLERRMRESQGPNEVEEEQMYQSGDSQSKTQQKRTFYMNLARNNGELFRTKSEHLTPQTQINAQNPSPPQPRNTPIPFTTAASTFVFGTRAVLATLRAKRRQLYNLYTTQSETTYEVAPKIQHIISVAKTIKLPVIPTTKASIAQHAKRMKAQDENVITDGICLEASPVPELPLTSLSYVDRADETFNINVAPQSREEAAVNGMPTTLKYSSNGWRHPFLLWLHGVVDSRNVGAIMRTALYYGVDAIILSARATANLTLNVHKSSAGASEFIPVIRVTETHHFIDHSSANGWKFFGTVAPPTSSRGHGAEPEGEDFTTWARSSFPSKKVADSLFWRKIQSRTDMLGTLSMSPLAKGPCCVVFGNEEEGLPKDILGEMDRCVSIGECDWRAKMAGLDSLNVGVAAAVVCERFTRRPSKIETDADKRRKNEKVF